MEVKEQFKLKDWQRMAVPQKDGTDTLLFIEYAKNTSLKVALDPRPEEPKIFNGKVALRYFDWDEKFLQEFEHAPFDHSSIEEAESLIGMWPEAYKQCGALLKAFNPMFIKDIEDQKNHPGSNSHQPKNTLGAVWATVHNPILLAQALVHEMAHNKLFAIGQHFESQGPLFCNDNDELFDSPVRLDIPRPISAVFHGVYAFTHVLALDRIMYKQLKENAKKQVHGLLRINALRIKKGVALIKKNARLTEEGKAFVVKFLEWADEEVSMAMQICKEELESTNTPIVLIGPDHTEKHVLAFQLGKKLHKKVINASEVCWDIWANSAIVLKRQAEVYGSDQVAKIFRNSKKFSNQEFLLNWIKKGVLHPEEIEFMKLQLCHYLITENPNAIICLGEDQAYLKYQDFINRLQRFFQDTDAKIIYGRPLLPIQKAVEKLNIVKTEAYATKLHTLLYQPSYRMLSSYTFDTNEINEESIRELQLTLEI